MNAYEKLNAVQSALKAPKGQFNKFGGYKYRSCEDILEAVKPLLQSVKAVILLTDEIVMLGNRFYVKAKATFADTESGQSIEVHAYAREEESKKGMDGSQVTGSASSYARKYALNGLLSIDDTKDSDATNTHGKEAEAAPEQGQPAIPQEQEQPCNCETCGKQIRDAKNSAGEVWKAKDIAVYTKLKFNKRMCVGCMNKAASDT